MCNLYSLTKSQDEIRRAFLIDTARTGNLPLLLSIFPKTAAPLVHLAEGQRMLSMYRWDMPSPAFALEDKLVDPGVTNVRNTGSPHWCCWLGPDHRCLVPLSAFSEVSKAAGGDIRFALSEERPFVCFAGIKADGWTSVRKLKDG